MTNDVQNIQSDDLHAVKGAMMGKKTGTIFFAVVCAVGVGFLVKFNKQTGIFRKLPEAAYLTESEAAERPAYQQLDDKEKAVYEALYRGITNKQEFIMMPYEMNGDMYSKVYCILEKQEGKFFYLGSSYYTAEKIREAQVVYRDEIDLADSKMAELENAENEALEAVNAKKSDYEKVMAINDYIVNNCRYVTGDDKEYSPTSYGCLVKKEANCEGYAKAFNMLAADAGLESMLITGITDKGENHAWNQVKVDGSWYNIDVTWADTDDGDEVRRAYFLCDDNDFVQTHTADTKYIIPMECKDIKENYYIKNDLYVDSLEKAEKIIADKIRSGQKMIEMKFAWDYLYVDFKKKYISDQYIFRIIAENGEELDGDLTVSIKEGDGDRCITLYVG